jgi:tetratricopeptide (TPR) repeat protein
VRWLGIGLALLGGSLLTTRTVQRNPTWLDTYTVLNTLAVEHPESYLSLRSRGLGLTRIGDIEGAQRAYDAAVELAPYHYGVLIEVAEFYGSRGQYPRAEELLARAASVTPDMPEAYLLISEYHIRQNRAREGHAVALIGLEQAGPDPRLFALLCESYVAKGDLEAAVRARLAALAQAPDDAAHWARLAELYEAMGRPEDARAARERATV